MQDCHTTVGKDRMHRKAVLNVLILLREFVKLKNQSHEINCFSIFCVYLEGFLVEYEQEVNKKS